MTAAIFISYSHENAPFVNRLREDLVAHGVRVWIDHESLPPGTPDWDEAIRVALRSVEAVLLVASPESRKSLFVRDELNVAQMYQRMIYPVWAAGEHWIDCVPIGWGATQYVDARGANYAAALKALLGAIHTAPAPATPSATSASTASPATPAKSITTNPEELAKQVQAVKESAQAQGASPTPNSGLSHLHKLRSDLSDLGALGALLNAKNWTSADEESKRLIRQAAGIAGNESINSKERAVAIPSMLLKYMDEMWLTASGAGLRSRKWVKYSSEGVAGDTMWMSLNTWLEWRLKKLGR